MLRRRRRQRPGATIASAGAWAVGGKLISKVLDFGTFTILAKVLQPEDFGLVALALTVVLILDALTDMPTSQPLLRAASPEPDHYHTAFTLGLLRAVVLAAAAILLSPLVTRFYGDQRLTRLLLLLAAAPILRSLSSPRMVDFARRYELRPDFAVNVISKAVAFAAVLTVALTAHSYWALATGSVVTALTTSALSHILAPYAPRLSLKRWRDFADVVGWSSASQVLVSVNSYLDRFVLGRVATLEVLGRYSVATDLSVIPFHAGVIPLTAPLIARFSRPSTESELAALWSKSINGVFLVFGSPLVLLAVLARPIVLLVLGERWLPASGLISAAALSAIPAFSVYLVGPLAIARYHSRAIFERTMANSVVLIPATILGAAAYGAYGPILANALSNLAAAAVAIRSVAKLTGVSPFRQLWDLHRTFTGYAVLASVSGLLPVALLRGAPVTTVGFVHLLAIASGAVLAGVAAQLATMWLLWIAEGRPSGVESTAVGAIRSHLGRPAPLPISVPAG